MPQKLLSKNTSATLPKAGKKALPATAQSRSQKKGRTFISPKSEQKQQAAKLQKSLSATSNRNLEETLAAKASAVKSLKILSPLAVAGAQKLQSNPKAGRTGRAVKGISKKK